MSITARRTWLLPAWLVVQGVLILGAKWVGGAPREGAFWLAATLATAALFALGGRSDVVRIARRDRIDERQLHLDLRAMALSGSLVFLGVFAGFLYEAAKGNSGAAYGWLLALWTLSYLGALTVLNRRA